MVRPLALALACAGCVPLHAERSAASASDARISNARGTFAGSTLHVEPEGNASRQADAWRTSDPVGAAIMDELARVPVAIWLGDWLPNVRATVDDALSRAGDELDVFVVYNVPHRDCGFWSAGGVADRAAYASFVSEVAAGLAGRLAIVVLEPDALALYDCLDPAAVADRQQMLADAVDTLAAAGAAVYLDAGDSNWVPAADMADRLLAAGVERAAGFALNVAHTEYTADEVAYAQEIRAVVGDTARFIVDTGRNGLGPAPDSEWCNPPGRANGQPPTLEVEDEGLDALLWVKPPGESDGSCNGGPEAGAWWPEYARDLAVRAGY